MSTGSATSWGFPVSSAGHEGAPRCVSSILSETPVIIICGMYRRLIFGMALGLAIAEPLSAQSPDSLSLDLTLGLSAGSSNRDNYYHPGAAAVEFTLAYGPVHTTGRIVALTVGGDLSFSSVCAIDEASAGACRKDFPSTIHLGVLGGFHRGTSHTALRAMVGPVAFGGDGESGAGGQLQLDAAAGFTHVALLAALHGQLLRRINGETLFLRSLGIGLRVQ